MTLRVLIADDEQMARKRMRRLLSDIEGVEIVAECVSGEDALAQLDRIDVDVALLDVRMGARSGLEVSDIAAELGVEVIFTTAHKEHAATAFIQGVVDYVLKPIESERLVQAIDRARVRLERARPAISVAPTLERLALSSHGEVRLLFASDISHAVVEGMLVHVWAKSESIVTDLTLSELERRLPEGMLLRVHRRALLNLAHVERLRPLPSGGYLAITREGHEVPVSRQAARGIRRRLGIV